MDMASKRPATNVRDVERRTSSAARMAIASVTLRYNPSRCALAEEGFTSDAPGTSTLRRVRWSLAKTLRRTTSMIRSAPARVDAPSPKSKESRSAHIRRQLAVQSIADAENLQIQPRPPAGKSAKTPPKIIRKTFKTDRMMDFFSDKELITQTGHPVLEWPLVFLKEGTDNGLDVCEEHDINPVIEITANATGISVSDNGPGLPESTLRGALDFSVRASSREANVSPTRGAQGNALKTLIPMPTVVAPGSGKFIVRAHGKQHVITCRADPISQRPVIDDEVTDMPTVGTEIRIEWNREWYDEDDGTPLWPFSRRAIDIEDSGRFGDMVEGFALFNPHATIRLDWFGKQTVWEATNTEWEKWKPHKPSSIHWFEQQHLERSIGAEITSDREEGQDQLLSSFVSQFDGLTGSQKRAKVLDETGLKRIKLSELVIGDRFDSARIAKLLASMKKHTRPVTSSRLGRLGEDHLRERLLKMGILPDSFKYAVKYSNDDLPWILEAAFGWRGDESEQCRKIFTGINWSTSIKNPFRTFGDSREGLEAALTEMRVGTYEPIVFVLHLAHPRVEYTDRGKSELIIGGAE